MSETTRPPPRPPAQLDTQLKRIYDHLYGNAEVRTPASIAEEVGKLLRVAAFLEKGTVSSPAFSFPPSLRKRLLQGSPGATRQVADGVRENFRAMNRTWKLYPPDAELALSDRDLAWCCAQLDGVVVSGGRRDVIGDAVELFRTSWAKQSSGQFFTDPGVTRLAMQLLRFEPVSGDDLVDICCGTGGFLLAGLEVIRARVREHNLQAGDAAVVELATRSLRGQEIDPEIAGVAAATFQCLLGARASRVIARGDSLAPTAFRRPGGRGLAEGRHRCAASNPPFGTKITVKDPAILADFDLAFPGGDRGRGRPSPRPPDVLLLEKNLRMLVPGVGRLAIVLPYQLLSGPQSRYVREWLLRKAVVEAVVDLPLETFLPHTGTKTSLVVLRRRAEESNAEAADGQVFLAVSERIGHDRRGHPVYRRGPDGKPTPELLSDLEEIAAAYRAFRDGKDPAKVHPGSFAIPAGRIAADEELRLNARYFRDAASARPTLPRRAGWKRVRLGDVVERVFCPGRFKRNYVGPGANGVPFFGGANITELLVETNKYLSPEDRRLGELSVRPGWLLVTRSGTTGVVSSVPRAWDGVAISEHVIRIVPDPRKLAPAWIFAYLRSSLGRRALASGVFGSVIDEITPEFVANLEVPVPPPAAMAPVIEAIQRAEEERDRAIRDFGEGAEGIEDLLAAALGGAGRDSVSA